MSKSIAKRHWRKQFEERDRAPLRVAAPAVLAGVGVIAVSLLAGSGTSHPESVEGANGAVVTKHVIPKTVEHSASLPSSWDRTEYRGDGSTPAFWALLQTGKPIR